jgi:cell division septum initiation protein DivIVA
LISLGQVSFRLGRQAGEAAPPPAVSAQFAVTRSGYNPEQVDDYLRYLDVQIRMLAADREAVIEQSGRLAHRVEEECAESNRLRNELRRLATAPKDAESISERTRVMLRLAQDEANELRSRAEAEAGEIVARAKIRQLRNEQLRAQLDEEREQVAALRAEAERLLAHARGQARWLLMDARARADGMVAEATRRVAGVVDEARAEAEQTRAVLAAEVNRLREEGRDERRTLDLRAAEERARIERNFVAAMSTRRAEVISAIRREQLVNHAEASRLLNDARGQARRIVEQARLTAAALSRAGERRHAEANRVLADARARAERTAHEARRGAASIISAAQEQAAELHRFRGRTLTRLGELRRALDREIGRSGGPLAATQVPDRDTA